jgi:hypothetical protein
MSVLTSLPIDLVFRFQVVQGSTIALAGNRKSLLALLLFAQITVPEPLCRVLLELYVFTILPDD